MSQYATIQEVNTSIMFGEFTNDQLTAIIQAVKYRRTQITKQNARTLRAGDTVKFVNPRTGRVHVGIVKRIKIKNVTVQENGITNWNVPANMLEAA